MKKLIWIFFALLSGTTVTAQQKSLMSLAGRWEAVDADNASGGIEVVDSARLFLVYGDQKKAIISYKADFSKSPAWFDFTVKDGANTIELQSLMQFINDDLVQWQIFEGTSRPVHFANDTGDVLYLRRKK